MIIHVVICCVTLWFIRKYVLNKRPIRIAKYRNRNVEIIFTAFAMAIYERIGWYENHVTTVRSKTNTSDFLRL